MSQDDKLLHLVGLIMVLFVLAHVAAFLKHLWEKTDDSGSD